MEYTRAFLLSVAIVCVVRGETSVEKFQHPPVIEKKNEPERKKL